MSAIETTGSFPESSCTFEANSDPWHTFCETSSYARASRPQLEIIQAIASENARDSAQNAAIRANKDSTTLTYLVGDKVLLFDPTNKVGESQKLQDHFYH